jgi:hypothetical protein
MPGTYKPNPEMAFDFFRVGIRRETYLSEDFYFCEDAAELGFQTYILPAAKAFHQGTMGFEMDLSKISAVASVLEQKQMNAAQSAKGARIMNEVRIGSYGCSAIPSVIAVSSL